LTNCSFKLGLERRSVNRKALALLSGGLDSTLAIKVILEQGIEVEALNFKTPFCLCDRGGCSSAALKVTKEFGIKIHMVNLGLEYLSIVKKPRFGYGKHLNPCIDCRIFMHQKAKKYMEQIGASFIITGEVLGQRPMSQRLDALNIIDRESGLKGYVLRPLSAKLLPPTIPEKEGIVDRERLLDIRGRSRKEQIELASYYDIEDYPCPAGGCLLTDEGFSRKMKDLLLYKDPITLKDINLLKVGRHFRIDPLRKVIIGRNKAENKVLETLAGKDGVIFKIEEIPGPSLLFLGPLEHEIPPFLGKMLLRYCTKKEEGKVYSMRALNVEGFEPVKIDCIIEEEILESMRI